MLIPWWEEACKLTGALLLPAVPLMGFHLLFGLAELGYDLWCSRTEGFFLGLAMFAGHGLFGSLSALILAQGGRWWTVYVVAGLAHLAYNLLLVRLVLPTLRVGAHLPPE